MDAVFSIATAIFVALILIAAFTFGFTLLVFFLCVAGVTVALMLLREYWYRWVFLRNAAKQETQDETIIEVEYKDITHDKRD